MNILIGLVFLISSLTIVFVYFVKIIPRVLMDNKGQIPDYGFNLISMVTNYLKIVRNNSKII